MLAVGTSTSATAIVSHSDGLDLLAGDRRLAELELSLVGEAMREQFLTSALEPIASRYELCVLDCPPNLGLLTVNALVAADRILVPVRMEDEGALQGVIELRAHARQALAPRRASARSAASCAPSSTTAARSTPSSTTACATPSSTPWRPRSPHRAGFHRQGVEGAPLVVSQPDSARRVRLPRAGHRARRQARRGRRMSPSSSSSTATTRSPSATAGRRARLRPSQRRRRATRDTARSRAARRADAGPATALDAQRRAAAPANGSKVGETATYDDDRLEQTGWRIYDSIVAAVRDRAEELTDAGVPTSAAALAAATLHSRLPHTVEEGTEVMRAYRQASAGRARARRGA